jgi:predicted DNA-binding protein
MFWIFKNKTPTKDELNDRESFTALHEGDNRLLPDMTNYSGELRVWLPTTVSVALGDMSDETNQTVSAYLREFFAYYLYGAHDFIRMQKEFTGVFYKMEKHSADLAVYQESMSEYEDIMFSRSSATESIPDLGKNIVPLKVYIAAKMKEDLQVLADKAGIPLSTFVREILVSNLLGHTFWAERLPKLTELEYEGATAWEN